MILGAPAFLWALASVPLILLLHLLRLRRRIHPVSSVLLWRRSGPALSSSRPLRRIERTLLLLLQVVAACALGLGLARPEVVATSLGGGGLVLVLDGSFSMRARDVAPTRFDRARAEAEALLRRARPGQQVAVVVAAPRPELLTPLTSDLGRARDALRGASPWDAPGDVAGAVALARSLAPAGRVRVAVWTDASHGRLPALPGVAYHVVGRSDDNVGITAFRVFRDPAREEAFLRVQNFGSLSRTVPVVVRLGTTPIARATLQLGPGQARSLTVPLGGGGRLRAELQVEDAVPEDNVAETLAGPSPMPSVLLVGPADPDLLRLLGALPAGRVAATSRADPALWAGFDVVVLNRVAPPALPPGNYLVLGAVPGGLPVDADGVLPQSAPAAWDPTDPLLRFVDLRGIHVTGALRLEVSGGRTVVDAGSPLVWAYEGRGVRVVLFAFSLDRTDLPRHVAFPVLLTNVLLFLGGSPPEGVVGEGFQLPSGGASRAVLTAPDGSRVPVRAEGGVLVLPPFRRAGIYRLEDGGRTREIAVSRPPGDAGLIRPGRPPAPLGDAAERSLLRARVSLWPWLLGVAAAAALGEWALATRRHGGDT